MVAFEATYEFFCSLEPQTVQDRAEQKRIHHASNNDARPDDIWWPGHNRPRKLQGTQCMMNNTQTDVHEIIQKIHSEVRDAITSRQSMAVSAKYDSTN